MYRKPPPQNNILSRYLEYTREMKQVTATHRHVVKIAPKSECAIVLRGYFFAFGNETYFLMKCRCSTIAVRLTDTFVADV